MAHIDRAYVAVAFVLLLVGELLGLYMGISSDLKHRALHITMVLPGFVTLAIFGFAFRLWPEMKAGPLAAAQFWLTVVSTLGLLAGTYQLTATGSVAIIAPSSMLAIVAAALLLWLFWTRTRTRATA
jgi:hypothetical protein